MRVTASNCNQQKTSTLLRVFDEIDRYDTDDIEEQVQILDVQSAVSRVLEKRGGEYSEEDNEWNFPVI